MSDGKQPKDRAFEKPLRTATETRTMTEPRTATAPLNPLRPVVAPPRPTPRRGSSLPPPLPPRIQAQTALARDPSSTPLPPPRFHSSTVPRATVTTAKRLPLPPPPPRPSEQPGMLALKGRLRGVQEELDALRAHGRALETKLAQAEVRCRALSRTELELRAQLRETAAEKESLRARLMATEHELQERAERIEVLERKVVQGTAATARAREELERLKQQHERLVAPTLDTPGDDLTKLRGVGPRFEKALHALGVHTYAQIAAWTDADIEDVAARLKIPAARIRRDGWVASARRLSEATRLS